jgi:hypothetical protein
MEEFRDIPGFPGLKATSLGRVIGKRGEEVGCFRGKYVIICGRTLPSPYTCLSRGNLILRAFVGPPPPDKPEVDHINRNKQDDRPENLRWVNRFENMQNRGVKCDSDSGIKGLYLHKATLPNHADRWRCTVKHRHTTFVQHFRLNQKEEAIEWLTQKRKELGIQN